MMRVAPVVTTLTAVLLVGGRDVANAFAPGRSLPRFSLGNTYSKVPRIEPLEATTIDDDTGISDTNRHTVASSSKSRPSAAAAASSSYDVVVIGSGLGGLSCAALCARYGYSVCVLESHSTPGGAAHGFTIRQQEGDYHFDTGPSFFSGLNPDFPAKASNPMRTVLEAVDERIDCVPYTTFGLKLPEGDFIHSNNFGTTGGALEQAAGTAACQEWQQVMEQMQPLAAAVDAMPTAALRGDVGALLTAGPFLKNFAGLNPLDNLKLTKPFARILEQAGLKNEFARNWLDLLCFCLSGLPADGTITAEMALMMGEFYDETAVMDCPRGGAKSLAAALVRGLEKYGGSIQYNSHVQRIVVENGKATAVQLRKGDRIIRANKAVVSNLSVWDLYGSGILDTASINGVRPSFVQERLETPVGKSFMHLHVGFRMSRDELEQLQAHYVCLQDWSRGVAADENAALVSIPSVHDDSLAPEGHAVLHIYSPATEDFSRWQGLDRKSVEYQNLKEERSQFLWQTLEKIIPDIRERATCVRVGTPLTHSRFLRRHRGSYGPAIRADEGSFPFPGTPVKGLLVCGDSVFPGIGVPAVAGSGILAANSVSLQSLPVQMKLLETMQTWSS